MRSRPASRHIQSRSGISFRMNMKKSEGKGSSNVLAFMFFFTVLLSGLFQTLGVLGYLELVDALLDVTVHEDRKVVH